MAISESKRAAQYLRGQLGNVKMQAAQAAFTTQGQRQDRFLEDVEREIGDLMKRLDDYTKGRIPAWAR